MNFKTKESMALTEDKIINNSFNSGEISFNPFTQAIKIDSKVSGLYDDQLGDVLEHRNKRELSDIIYKIFKESTYYEKYKNPKRVDKTDMVKMYYFFKDNILSIKIFTNIEIFIGFAEFFQINYDQLYSEVKVKDKELLLRELNEKLGLSDRIKTKRLF